MAIPAFLQAVEALLRSGDATEHSYRPALQQLFAHLFPNLKPINEPKHAAYGAPDFVFQLQSVPIGHLEAKDIGANLAAAIQDSQRNKPQTSNGKQLQRYCAALPNLLYSDGLAWYWFVGAELRTTEPVVLATWNAKTKKLTPTPSGITDLHSLLSQFAQNTSLTISKPRELAQRLAQIAHWLRDVISEVFKGQTAKGSLHQQLEAFKKTLLPDLDADEFADMYAQTIVYGLFAARVSLPDAKTFTRTDAAMAIPKTNPFLRSLFQQIAGYDLDSRIAWLVDDCAALLAHTDMREVMRDFGRATRQEDPVIHFYETFLAAYDAKLREVRGVYYTPEPVVSFIVRSVHALLQRDFQRPFGLADDSTIILDPATGTATFLNTVIQLIHQELADQGLAGTWDQYVPEKLLPRIFGFELLMAPYTIAHLKLGNLLQQLGYRFQSDERLGIYLTNALDEAPSAQQAFAFAQTIAEEAEAANEVKHNKHVMVVLGNPPYSGHSANTSPWISELIDDYKKNIPSSQKLTQSKWLQNDYVKFIRFGQWKINNVGEGIIAFITSNVYLDSPTFIGMRKSLINDFNDIYIVNLHGSSLRDEGDKESGNVNVFDIKQGVSIIFLVKNNNKNKNIYYKDVFGERKYKYEFLGNRIIDNIDWISISPDESRALLCPVESIDLDDYSHLSRTDEIFNAYQRPSPGIVTTHDQFAISWNEDDTKRKINLFLETQDEEEARKLYKLCSQEQWNYDKAKNILKSIDWENQITKILYRPFDIRWTVYNSNVAVHRRERVTSHIYLKENLGLHICKQVVSVNWAHIYVTNYIPDDCLVSNKTKERGYFHALYIYNDDLSAEPSMFDQDQAQTGRRANLSPSVIAEATNKLGLVWVADGKGDLQASFGPEDLFHYIYAVLHSPSYRERYAEFLKIDFPRVPITSERSLFATLVGLGAALVDVHLLRLPGAGGVGGAGGATILQKPGLQGLQFPVAGNSVVEKIRYNPSTTEVWINEQQKFVGVEPETWAMQIGGYQPLEKWLKDRKGRRLNADEISHYLRMVLALRETKRLMQAIDAAIPAWPMS